jgi:hypothetical protein
MTYPNETRNASTYPAEDRDVDTIDPTPPHDEAGSDSVDTRDETDADVLDTDSTSPDTTGTRDETDADLVGSRDETDADLLGTRDHTDTDVVGTRDETDADLVGSRDDTDTDVVGTRDETDADLLGTRDDTDTDVVGTRDDTDADLLGTRDDTTDADDVGTRDETDADLLGTREDTDASGQRDEAAAEANFGRDTAEQDTDLGQPVDAAWPMSNEHPTDLERSTDEAEYQAGETEPAATVEPMAGEPFAETVPPEGDLSAEPAETESTELMPGDVPDAPVAGLWGADAADGLRDRWRALQLRFVDDPLGAADEAASLVGEAVESLMSSLSTHQRELDDWRSSAGAPDTEQLRMTVRRYREFLDRLLEL